MVQWALIWIHSLLLITDLQVCSIVHCDQNHEESPISLFKVEEALGELLQDFLKSFKNEKLQTKEDFFDIVLAILISRVRYTSYETTVGNGGPHYCLSSSSGSICTLVRRFRHYFLEPSSRRVKDLIDKKSKECRWIPPKHCDDPR